MNKSIDRRLAALETVVRVGDELPVFSDDELLKRIAGIEAAAGRGDPEARRRHVRITELLNRARARRDADRAND